MEITTTVNTLSLYYGKGQGDKIWTDIKAKRLHLTSIQASDFDVSIEGCLGKMYEFLKFKIYSNVYCNTNQAGLNSANNFIQDRLEDLGSCRKCPYCRFGKKCNWSFVEGPLVADQRAIDRHQGGELRGVEME